MSQYIFLFAFSLVGAILTFVGITALLPLGIYRKIFGRIWPVDPSEFAEEVMERRLTGIVITVIGFIILKASLGTLSACLK